jgi:hypothetical protein
VTTPAAQVAQLVEHVTENHGVGGSIPPLGTIKINGLARIWRLRLSLGTTLGTTIAYFGQIEEAKHPSQRG